MTPSFLQSSVSKEWIWGTRPPAPGGRGGLGGGEKARSRGPRESHSWTYLGGCAADTKPPATGGHHPRRVKWEAPRHSIASFPTSRLPLVQLYSFMEEGGRALARTTAAPLGSGGGGGAPVSPALSECPQNATHTAGMSLSPEASPSDPILRSGLPECSVKRALAPLSGPGEGGKEGSPRTEGSTPAAPWDLLCHLTWFSSRMGHRCPRAPGPPRSQEGKQEGVGASCQSCYTCSPTRLDALISRGSLPLLKSFQWAKNRFKVNN